MSIFPWQTPGYEDLEVSTQLVIKEALRRGVRVQVLDRKDNFIRLQKGDKTEYIKQATKTALDSYITFLIMENKYVTKLILEEQGIRVPKGKLYHSIGEAYDDYKHFLNITCVVKPLSTNFGIGISFVSPNSKDYFKKALEMAFLYDKSVIVEEYITGKEYRFLVIGGKTVAITHRVPAKVSGDGKSTITQLINLKNRDPLRTIGIPTPLNIISQGEVERIELARQGLTFKSRLKKGQPVFLRKNSNISTGGEAIDYTDQMRSDYKRLAEKASQIVRARICGVDMIISDINKAANKKNYAIIELNFNPTLGFHDFPSQGKNREVEKAVLDVLGF